MTKTPNAIPADYQFVFDGDNGVQFASTGDPLGPAFDYDIDDLRIAVALGTPIPPEIADLIDLAIAVYVSDRLARRRPPHADLYHLYWPRRMRITLPVRDPSRWNNTRLGNHLHKLLRFLTDDNWYIDFTARRNPPRASETSMASAMIRSLPVEPVRVGLFSGGLDSFAGACHELLGPSKGTYFLLSGRTNSRIGERQDSLARSLRRRTARDVRHLVVEFGLRNRWTQHPEDEPTQRSRGFVFPILAAAVALMGGGDEVVVYEPGIGAINLPYTEAQLGAQATRATDPRTLIGISTLVSAATGRPLTVRGEFLFATKSEICANIVAFGLADLAKETISCDSVSLRVKGHTHCGRCTSCVLRRQGLYGAGLGELDRRAGIYKDDILAGPGAVRFEKLHSLRAMDYQASKIEWALRKANPWLELSRLYPQLVEIAIAVGGASQDVPLVGQQLIDLYRHYCAEWARFRERFAGVPAASGR